MTTYVVQKGDTLSAIAQTFGVSLPALEAANPQIPNPNLIFPGQVITVPVNPTPPGTYVVQPGDTMSGIAQNFGISLGALEAANPQIPDPNVIFPGQVLTIPASVVTYVVQPGDTMSGIAETFGVSLSALEAANPQIPDPNVIFPGQVLTIPATKPVSFFDYWIAHDSSMQLSENGTGTLILGDGAFNTDKWAVTWTKNPSDSITITLASLLGRNGPGMGNVGDQYIATIQPDATGIQRLFMHRVGTTGQVITFSIPGSPGGS
jgi:LysM repeat protein